MDKPEKCGWRWQNAEGTVDSKCIRPPGHRGNHIGFWSAPQDNESTGGEQPTNHTEGSR